MAREVTLVDAGLGNIASVERALIQVGAAVRVTGDPDLVARARLVVFPGQGAFGAATKAMVEGAMGEALRMVVERGDPFLGICLGMQLLFDGSDEASSAEGLHVLPGRCRRFPDGMTLDPETGAEDESLEPEPADPRAALEQAHQHEHPAPTYEEQPSLILAGGASAFIRSESATSSVLGETEERGPANTEGTVPAPPLRQVATGGSAALEVAVSSIESPSIASVVQSEVVPPEPPLARSTEPLVRRLKVPHMGWNEVEPTGDHYYFVHSYYVEPERSEDVMWMTTYGGIRFPAAVRHQNVLGCQFHPEKSQRAGLKFLRAFLLGGWG